MLDYRLTKKEQAELRAAHRRALNVREAYRIKAVILLGYGWSKRGEERPIKSNTGRRRPNIDGAIDVQRSNVFGTSSNTKCFTTATYYQTVDDYKDACKRFFHELDSYASQLRSLPTENFEVIVN